jgi:hypothetical protein
MQCDVSELYTASILADADCKPAPCPWARSCARRHRCEPWARSRMRHALQFDQGAAQFTEIADMLEDPNFQRFGEVYRRQAMKTL